MTTAEATSLNIPRWMVLAMPDDVDQIVAVSKLVYHTPVQQRAARDYWLRELRRTQWDRAPRRPSNKPPCLRPSKVAGGYRTDSGAHRQARLTVNPETRRAIARKGAAARWNAESSSSH